MPKKTTDTASPTNPRPILRAKRTQADDDRALRAALTEIAKEHLNLKTLERRGSDGLDFSDQAVWSIRAALEAAYKLGRESR